MSRYRAAVIGLGRMGSTFDDEVVSGGNIYVPYCHGPSYYHSPLFDLVAGADIHPEQRASFGKRWGLLEEHIYADYREMLANEMLDIVSICTTARHRASIVQDVARAGVKLIWAEKPMAISLEDADDMVRVCREEGVLLAINCQRRWHPIFSEARAIIDAGDLGAILQVTAYAGCKLSSNGSHLLDAVRFLAGGEIQWVFGEIESDEVAAGDDDPMGNGYLVFDNGVRAYVRSMESGAAYWEFDVIGTRGRIRILQNGMEAELILVESTDDGSRAFRGASSRVDVPLHARYPFPMPARMQGTGLTILEDLFGAIKNGVPPRCSGEDGLAAMEAAIAIRESHRLGGSRVTFPLEDRSLRILSSETVGDESPKRFRETHSARANR